jgi:8-oxo-dGTP pyrophosphatase MutT (NUDIX family)
VSAPVLDAAWRAALDAKADQLPSVPRVPLWSGAALIGSVEPDLLRTVGLPPGIVEACVRDGAAGWQVHGYLTASLGVLANAMREAGVAHAWRDEQLAVTDEAGNVLGTVERAVVRPLGITTFAVHLAALSPDGRHWVQQRSLTKPNDPGLWDTLMGGMVPASDSLAQALARETWEEAGLRLEQIEQLAYGGRVSTRRPSDRHAGYVVEYIDWYRCVLPEGVVPINQDGEVAEFRLMDADEVRERLSRDEFTLEAALVLTRCGV